MTISLANMVMLLAILALVAVAGVGGGLILARRARRGDSETDAKLGDAIEAMSRVQSELGGRISQLAEAQNAHQAAMAERFQAQERALAKSLEDRFHGLTRRIDARLENEGQKTQTTVGEIKSRLAVIDAAQKNITDLSQKVVSLQDILSNKQARGAFGEIQLNDLVQNALPPSAYEFQAQLENGKRADCLLKLPNPPGPIVVDAKFPLESYTALRAADDDHSHTLAAREFRAAVIKHINAIAEKYIVPGVTAESALMFLPSEAVYAELHANFTDVVERSYRARVWIVSPTTMMATLNTVRAVLKDAKMREQAAEIQKQVLELLKDVERLDKRVSKLQTHFNQANDDLRQIQISTDKINRRGERIETMQLEDAPEAVPQTPELPRESNR